jgi:hypothetical protein
MNAALHRLLCAALLVAASLMLVLVLPGYGGGGMEDIDAQAWVGPPDCQNRPELCQ